jgi:hypothetical protein
MTVPGQPAAQPVLSPLTGAAIFLVLSLTSGGEADAWDLLADPKCQSGSSACCQSLGPAGAVLPAKRSRSLARSDSAVMAIPAAAAIIGWSMPARGPQHAAACQP